MPSNESTLAPIDEYDWTCVSFGPPESTTKTASRSVRPKPFLHSSRQKVPILYNRRPFPPKLPLPIGGSGSHLIYDFLGSSEPTTQMASRSVQPFLHRWPQSVPIIYNGMFLPALKIAPFHGGSGPRLIHGSLRWITRVLNSNGISIGSAVFARLTSVTDRPTDRTTDHATRSVTIGHIYV